MSQTELATVAKSLRTLTTYEVRKINAQARQAGDKTLAAQALAELKQRGK